MKDYYAILDIEPNATADDIKAQYRLMIQAWHPDKFGSLQQKAKAEAKAKEINEAYGVLSNPAKRGDYDTSTGRMSTRQNTSKEDVQRKAQEDVQRKAQDNAKRRAQEEAYRKSQEEVKRKAQEEADRRAQEDSQRRAKEEADRKAHEEAERQAIRNEQEKRMAIARKENSQVIVRFIVFAVIAVVAILYFLSTVLRQSDPVALPASQPKVTVTHISQTNDLVLTLAPNVKLDLVRIPPGTFMMGSTDADRDAWFNEKPQHKVILDEYLIGKYDVTNAQYSIYAQAKGLNWSIPQGKENHPVVMVSWDDAVAFCAWASQVTGHNVTLPTEAQWEKAARGTDGRIYPWGNDAPNNTQVNVYRPVSDTTEVGKYSPIGDSPYGLADMVGNVWEWVADMYSDTYYASSPSSNPLGPNSGQLRVLRGGSWYNSPLHVRAALRDHGVTSLSGVLYGFRVAVSAPVQ